MIFDVPGDVLPYVVGNKEKEPARRRGLPFCTLLFS